MTIVNSTNVNILISSEILVDSYELEPNGLRFYNGRNIYKLNIHSDIGSCEIKVSYRKITVRNFGKLVAVQSEEKDKKGLRNIIITSI